MRRVTVRAVALASIALWAIPAVCDDSVSRLPTAGNSVPFLYWTSLGDQRWFFKPIEGADFTPWQIDALIFGLTPKFSPVANAVGFFGCPAGCEASSYSNSSINTQIGFTRGEARFYFTGGVGQNRFRDAFLSWTERSSATWNVGVGFEYQISPYATVWARWERSASIGCGSQCMAASPLSPKFDEQSVLVGLSWTQKLWKFFFPGGSFPGPQDWEDNEKQVGSYRIGAFPGPARMLHNDRP